MGATPRLTGWRHGLRAVAAIFRKDLQIFLGYRFNMVMRIVEPIMWMAPALVLGRAFAVDGVNTGLQGYTGTSDYTAFLVVGGVISSYVSAVCWGMGFSLKNEMDIGVLESNWLSPVPVLVQMLGRSLFSLFITTVNTLAIGLIVWLMFGFELVGSAMAAIAILLPLLVALYGFGLGLAAIVLMAANANQVIDVGNFVVTTLSGSNFPVTVLPRPLLAVALALPLTYAYDAVRGQLLGTHTLAPPGTARLIMLALVLATVVPGILLFTRTERICRDRGALARH
jgi:ABC-2 type transport system permease protein